MSTAISLLCSIAILSPIHWKLRAKNGAKVHLLLILLISCMQRVGSWYPEFWWTFGLRNWCWLALWRIYVGYWYWRDYTATTTDHLNSKNGRLMRRSYLLGSIIGFSLRIYSKLYAEHCRMLSWTSRGRSRGVYWTVNSRHYVAARDLPSSELRTYEAERELLSSELQTYEADLLSNVLQTLWGNLLDWLCDGVNRGSDWNRCLTLRRAVLGQLVCEIQQLVLSMC